MSRLRETLNRPATIGDCILWLVVMPPFVAIAVNAILFLARG